MTTAVPSAVLHLVVGPHDHGVVRYARAVHASLAMDDSGQRLTHVADADAAVAVVAQPCGPLVHIHVTDKLFGSGATAAATAVVAVVDAAHAAGTRVSLTLHDLPQPSDGAGFHRRRDAYRAMLTAADGVIVSSEHESRLIDEHLGWSPRPPTDVEVIPLMVGSPGDAVVRVAAPTSRSVGVLGFLYPGKGHAEVLRAMAASAPDVVFVALGTPSPGHTDLADQLTTDAAAVGRGCEITGFLDDAQLAVRLAEVGVPVAHHRHLSASGSINTWRAARRRPLVPRHRYSEEMDRMSPRTMTLYDEDRLSSAIAEALADPASTWIDAGRPVHPSPAEVAMAHRTTFARWSR
ncbi:glycosyltransferase family protein [Williamsia sterculiae]|uniref:Uncharacterized protein n=1 Tax=Williamsia sterculiae TaxID=1344003 RepID=A0A1N7EPJ0_9NOCA|nr:hypothetical protein [Williamsia sterculiae]SIR90017.1 hypothetical protein SAMN05445060_1536 [Williamsia sterculiae]